MVEKTKKLEAKLFQVRAQLERTLSAKLDNILNLWKSAFNRTGLGYDFSSPSIASTSTTMFVSLTNNVEYENNDMKNILASENIDKGKFIFATHPKLDKMLNIQKSALDRTSLGYGLSSFNTTSTSTTVFVPLASNTEIENTDVKISLASENLDKGKSILGAPLKLDKKDVKNPKAKKANFQKPKQKKQHLCHHYGVAGHT